MRAPHVMHGKTSRITHDGRGVFAGLPDPVHRDPLPLARRRRASPSPTASRSPPRAEDGLVMGLRHRELPIEGVQFHPESILTESGHDLLRNFLGSSALRLDAVRAASRTRPSTAARPSATSDASASASSSATGVGAFAQPAQHAPAPLAERCPRTAPAGSALSSGSTPRVAHTRGERARRRTRLARAAQHRADVHQREQPVAAAQRSRRPRPSSLRRPRSVSRSPATRSTHAADVHLDRGDVGVVGLRGDRGRGVAADPGQAREVVGPAVVGDDDRGLPEPAGPARVAEAAPRGDHRARPGRGHRRGRGELGDELAATRRRAGTWVWWSITSETRTPTVAGRAPREVVAAVGVVPAARASGRVRARSRFASVHDRCRRCPP